MFQIRNISYQKNQIINEKIIIENFGDSVLLVIFLEKVVSDLTYIKYYSFTIHKNSFIL